MSYARSRLWLGISGVGTGVLIALWFLTDPRLYLLIPSQEWWDVKDFVATVTFVSLYLMLMTPFDVLGGYLLPRKFGRSQLELSQFTIQWFKGIMTQGLFYTVQVLLLLAIGRLWGLVGVLLYAAGFLFVFMSFQENIFSLFNRKTRRLETPQVDALNERVAKLGFPPLETKLAEHRDQGFTGGVVGLPGKEVSIIPQSWLDAFSTDELAVITARRRFAIDSGLRTKGLVIAALWNLAGFTLALLAPGGGYVSVMELFTTFFWFTLWTFLGLLILPTISRRASCRIDQIVTEAVGEKRYDFLKLLTKLDQRQDDEPERTAFIETIFHPIPSVYQRIRLEKNTSFAAWHAARMMVFLSLPFVGLLSRAVHCNAGRPELWTLLPTDS